MSNDDSNNLNDSNLSQSNSENRPSNLQENEEEIKIHLPGEDQDLKQEEEFVFPELFEPLLKLIEKSNPNDPVVASTNQTISILQTALRVKPTKELLELTEALLKHLEYKKAMSNRIRTNEQFEKFQQEKESYNFKIKENLETLLIEACIMGDVKSRNDKLIKINYWYKDRINLFKDLHRITERTATDKYQLDDCTYLAEKTKGDEKYFYDINGNEIDEATFEKLRRTHIPGYDNKKDKLDDFIHRKINSKETERIAQMRELADPNHYYQSKNKPPNDNLFNVNVNSNGNCKFNSTFSKDIFNSTAYGNASSFGNSTYYTTQTSMKYANRTGYNNASGFGYNYNNKADFNFNKTISTGWNYNNDIGMSNTNGFYDKEIKANYTFNRPKYGFDTLALESQINKNINKELKYRRMNQEIKNSLIDYGKNKARYKEELNKKYEMMEMLKNYNWIYNKRKKSEISSTNINANPVLKTEGSQPETKPEPTSNTNIIQTEPSLPIIPIPTEQNQNQTPSSNQNSIPISNNQSVPASPPPEITRPKVDTSNVKYITNSEQKQKDKNESFPKKLISDLDKDKDKEKIFNIYTHYRKIAMHDNLSFAINKKIEKDRQLKEELKHNDSKINDPAYIKEKNENQLDSESIFSCGRINNIFNVRRVYDRMNNYELCVDKVNNTQLKPLSFFDDENLGGRIKKTKGFIENNKLNTENNILRTTLNRFNDDFLQMRKTLSQFHVNKMKNSKLYKKGNKKIKFIIKNIYDNSKFK